jgi:gamma-glutamyl-gamma-aminobutyrate hydrolase PuuD
MAHGALAFMVPTVEAGSGVRRTAISLRDYVRELDGLVLQGGADVSPLSYGQQPRRPHWRGDRVRDLYEIDLLWECVFQRKPVLGICRGAQLINVAFNGSLHQDIAEEVQGAISHVDTAAYDQLHHDVAFEAGGSLSALYGGLAAARVTSIHHQAVKELGDGLRVEARSPADGVVEAIRWDGPSFVLGLQWHPEFHADAAGLLDSSPIMLHFLEQVRVARTQRWAPLE